MTDEIDKMFSDLDTYYPGSKRKRREPKAPEVEVDDTWESKSYTKTLPNGKDMEFYTIGALVLHVKRIQWPNQQLTNAIAEAWKNIQVEDSKTTETKE